MNRKGWGIAFCAVLLAGLVGYGLLTRGRDRAPHRVEAAPSAEPLKVVPSGEPVEEVPSATQPVVPADEKKSRAFQIRVMWLDTNLPVEGATVTLIPEPNGKTQKKETAQPAISLTGLTDKTGTLSLECPPDLATTGTLHCQVRAEHTGAVSLFIRNQTVSTTRTLTLNMQRAYGYFGTVYRRDAAGKFVPAAGAMVSAVSALSGSFGQSNPSATATCDAEGHYTIASLPENIVYLWGQWEDQVTVESKLPVMGKPGERSGPFDLYLEQGASLTALVSDKTTLKPIPGATVEVKFSGELSRSATADSAGFCEVKGLPLGRIEVFARAEGYADESSPMEITPEGTLNTVPFFLDKGGQVRITTVGGKDGKPIANVPLKVRGEATIEAISDSTGCAVLDGLKTKVKWSVIPIGDYASALVPIGDERIGLVKTDIPTFVPEVEKTVEVIVRVVNRIGNKPQHKKDNHDFVSVEGTVVDESGEPVPGAIVTAISKCCRSSVVANTSGEFRIENACVEIFPSPEIPLPDLDKLAGNEVDLSYRDYYLPRPNYVLNSGASVSCYIGPATLQVEANGYVPVDGVRVAIDSKPQIVLKDKADGVLKIQVSDGETSQPILDYWFRGWHVGESRDGVIPKTELRVCAQDGSFSKADLSVGKTYSINIRAEGYIEKTIQENIEKNPADNQVDLFLDRQKQLQGVVVDAETQQPIEGIEIRYTVFNDTNAILRALQDLANIPSEQTFYTDSKGEFQFSITKPTGSLIFLPSQYARIAFSLGEIEQYRDPKSGKIVIPLKKSDEADRLR